MKPVVLASSNVGKLHEMGALLQPLGFELVTQSSLGIRSPPETDDDTTVTVGAGSAATCAGPVPRRSVPSGGNSVPSLAFPVM